LLIESILSDVNFHAFTLSLLIVSAGHTEKPILKINRRLINNKILAVFTPLN